VDILPAPLCSIPFWAGVAEPVNINYLFGPPQVLPHPMVQELPATHQLALENSLLIPV